MTLVSKCLIKRTLWSSLVVCVALKDYYYIIGFHIKATKSISKETCIFLSVKHTEKFLRSLNGTNHLLQCKRLNNNVFVDFFCFVFLCNTLATSKTFKDDALMEICEGIVDFLSFSWFEAWWRSNSRNI